MDAVVNLKVWLLIIELLKVLTIPNYLKIRWQGSNSNEISQLELE